MSAQNFTFPYHCWVKKIEVYLTWSKNVSRPKTWTSLIRQCLRSVGQRRTPDIQCSYHKREDNFSLSLLFLSSPFDASFSLHFTQYGGDQEGLDSHMLDMEWTHHQGGEEEPRVGRIECRLLTGASAEPYFQHRRGKTHLFFFFIPYSHACLRYRPETKRPVSARLISTRWYSQEAVGYQKRTCWFLW